MPLLLNEGSFSKASAPPLFVAIMEVDFWKMFSSSRKRGGADFSPGFVWWIVWAES
jgi:hypothetical protein